MAQAEMDRPPATAHEALIVIFLDEHPDIKFVRLLWLDYTSILRGRVLTATYMRQLAGTKQHHGLCGLNLVLVGNSPPFPNNHGGGWPTGQSLLCVDARSLRHCPQMADHALAFCHFADRIPPPPAGGSVRLEVPAPMELRISDLCPRKILRDALSLAADDIPGSGFMVGFEIEFVVCLAGLDNRAGPGSPGGKAVTTHLTSGMRTLEAFAMPVLCEVVNSLQACGISVLHFHAESIENQFEIALAPMTPLRAIDALVITCETIWNTFRQQGMPVSFSPESPENNGVHLNLSLQGLSANEEDIPNFFLAGVLHHFGGLCAFGMRRHESYDRTTPGSWCVGRYKAWGTQNRQVAIRKKDDAFWEMRFLDAFANYYLFLAALIFAGRDGVLSQRSLDIQDCREDPAFLTEEERHSRYNIHEELPSSPEESFQCLSNDSYLNEMMGKRAIDSYIAVARRDAGNR